jgi:hypothetical protein
MECRRRFAPRLADFISFERALHDIGDRPSLAARQAARLGAADGKLRFGQIWVPESLFAVVASNAGPRWQGGPVSP